MNLSNSEDDGMSDFADQAEESELDSLPSDLDDFDDPKLTKGATQQVPLSLKSCQAPTSSKILSFVEIVNQIFESCGKAKVCPPSLQSNMSNVKKFVTAIVLYAKEVPPQFWHFLVDSTASNSPNVVVDPGLFPQNYVFAGSVGSKTSEVEEGQLNFHRVLQLAKGLQFDSGSRRPSVEVASILKYIKSSSGNKGGDFGKLLCGLLVKLIDARCNKGLVPSQKLRETHLGKDSIILKGYAALKRTPYAGLWRKKLCIDHEHVESFPYALCDLSSDVELAEDYLTDLEGEVAETEKGPIQSKTPTIYRGDRELAMSTQESIERAEEELEIESQKEKNYLKMAAQCSERAVSIREKILQLTRRLSKEQTDTSVVSILAEKLGFEEYVKHGSEVPRIYLEVREYWKAVAQPLPWDAFWSDVKNTLDQKYRAPGMDIPNQTPTNPDPSSIASIAIPTTDTAPSVVAANDKIPSNIPDFSMSPPRTASATPASCQPALFKEGSMNLAALSADFSIPASSSTLPSNQENDGNPVDDGNITLDGLDRPIRTEKLQEVPSDTTLHHGVLVPPIPHQNADEVDTLTPSKEPKSNSDDVESARPGGGSFGNLGIRARMGTPTGVKDALKSAVHTRRGPQTPSKTAKKLSDEEPTTPVVSKPETRTHKRKHDLDKIKEVQRKIAK